MLLLLIIRPMLNQGLFPARFGNFFNHVDSFASEAFLYVTSGGIRATRFAGSKSRDKDLSIDAALGTEPDDAEVRSGAGEEG